MPELLAAALGKDDLCENTDSCAPGEGTDRRIRKRESFTRFHQGDSQRSHFYGLGVSKEVTSAGEGF